MQLTLSQLDMVVDEQFCQRGAAKIRSNDEWGYCRLSLCSQGA
jgi:hypothetical protein